MRPSPPRDCGQERGSHAATADAVHTHSHTHTHTTHIHSHRHTHTQHTSTHTHTHTHTDFNYMTESFINILLQQEAFLTDRCENVQTMEEATPSARLNSPEPYTHTHTNTHTQNSHQYTVNTHTCSHAVKSHPPSHDHTLKIISQITPMYSQPCIQCILFYTHNPTHKHRLIQGQGSWGRFNTYCFHVLT